MASVAGFLAYFQLLRTLSPVPLSLVFIFFPVVGQLVAVVSGERAMGGSSLALLGLVLGASVVALTGRPAPRDPAPARPASRAAIAPAR